MAKFKRKSFADKKKEVDQLATDRNEKVEKYFRSSEDMKEYLGFMAKFYNYSVRNSTLIQKQFSGAEAVGSYNFWKKEGFPVQKGEKGISILVPAPFKTFDRKVGDKTERVNLKNATATEKAAIDRGEIKTKEWMAYAKGNVFEVSQTDAKAEDLPKVFPNKWLEGSVENYEVMFQSMQKLGKEMGVETIPQPMRELGAAKGTYVEFTKRNDEGEMGVETLPEPMREFESDKKQIVDVIESELGVVQQERETTIDYIRSEENDGDTIDKESVENANIKLEKNDKKIENLTSLKEEIENIKDRETLNEVPNERKIEIQNLIDNQMDRFEELGMENHDNLQEVYALSSQDDDPSSYNEGIKELEKESEKISNKVSSLNDLKEKLPINRVIENNQNVEFTKMNEDGEMVKGRGIELNPRNSELQNVKTMIHELAHADLHSSDSKGHDRSHPEKEFQAEMTAYTVASHFNLDTSDYSLQYLKAYTSKESDINDKFALLEEVKDTSFKFIIHLENDLEPVREQTEEKQSFAELKQQFSDFKVASRDGIEKVEDMDEETFASRFRAEDGRNILGDKEFQTGSPLEKAQKFN